LSLICRQRNAKVRIHQFESPKRAQEEKAGRETFQKHSIRIGLMNWLASDKGSCFKQEKLLGLDEEDI